MRLHAHHWNSSTPYRLTHHKKCLYNTSTIEIDELGVTLHEWQASPEATLYNVVSRDVLLLNWCFVLTAYMNQEDNHIVGSLQ